MAAALLKQKIKILKLKFIYKYKIILYTEKKINLIIKKYEKKFYRKTLHSREAEN